MSQLLKNDPEHGVGVAGGSVYFSLGSTHWQNLVGWNPKATYNYSPPSPNNDNLEMATLNMAKFGTDGKFYSARLRLDVALGFGRYEQSIKVGKGQGICTAFYLSQKEKDQNQEIDFEFAGHCNKDAKPPCGTQGVWTNVWWGGKQYPNMTPLWVGTPPTKLPDTTSGRGKGVYRYMIDWEPETVTWSVDLTGTGNSYVAIRTQAMAGIGRYDESLCQVFFGFWPGFSPGDGSEFQNGNDAETECDKYGRCYQAFLFQPLKFTPSATNNRLVTLA
jgi:hypothetical protein